MVVDRREVLFQRYDAGQRRIAEHKTRHRVVRCGRRRGKTTFGEIMTCHEATNPHYIGWFVPSFKLLAEVWRNLRSRLAPLIVRANDAEHRIELITGAVIEGWTLEGNPEAGRSRKYHLAIVDECGLIDGLRRWWDSCLSPTLIDFRGRAVFLGTPHVISPDFDELYDLATTDTEGEFASFTETTFDNPHLPPDELRKIHARRTSMPEWLWLQEYMAIPADSASGFFPRSVLSRHAETHGCDPVARGTLLIDADSTTDAAMVLEKRQLDRLRWVDDPRGPWRLWFDPTETGGRPVQSAAWCFGIDIGGGVGAANSVIAAGDADTGVKWAEYASPGVLPEQFARESAAAGLWFGGRQGMALVQWESNGTGGEVFSREIMRARYARLCSMNRHPGDLQARSPSVFGWRSSRPAKETLLIEYRGALAHDKLVNPSLEAIKECRTYRYAKSGALESVPTGISEEAFDDARAPHGDRVIADALLWDAMKVVPLAVAEPLGPTPGGIWERIKKSEKSHGKRQKLVY